MKNARKNPANFLVCQMLPAICAFVLFNQVYSQNDPIINQLQYGATIRAKFELRYHCRQEPKINFRLSAGAGIAGKWLIDECYPSANVEMIFYNGGLGSSSRPGKRKAIMDVVLALTFTTGRPSFDFRHQGSVSGRYVPLRYFSDFSIPALQNPYNYALSAGSNFVYTTDRDKSRQVVGFANVLFAEGVQVSYYNDGTPFGKLHTGDGRDRYYTGGGFISYSHSQSDGANTKAYQFELSYQKFSGYSQDAFEFSNLLHTSNIDYLDTEQNYYNKSLWQITGQLVSNADVNYSLTIAYYNSVRYDMQHFIHDHISNSFHIVPYERNLTIMPATFYFLNGFKN